MVPHMGISCRTFDTVMRADAAYHESLGMEAAQHGLQMCRMKPALARLLDDDIAALLFQLVDNLGSHVPSAT